jgi:hypothetical protein
MLLVVLQACCGSQVRRFGRRSPGRAARVGRGTCRVAEYLDASCGTFGTANGEVRSGCQIGLSGPIAARQDVTDGFIHGLGRTVEGKSATIVVGVEPQALCGFRAAADAPRTDATSRAL